MRDSDLIKLIQEKPDVGMNNLINQYLGLVCSVVKGKLSGICTNEDIEECVSDVFIDFYYQTDRFDYSRGTIKAYLCSIAKHKAVNLYIVKAKEHGNVSLDDEAYENTVDDGFSVEDVLLTSETRDEIMKAIVSLGEPDHEIIVRRFFFSEPSKSIAARLNMTVTSVNVRTHRALAKLKEKLGDLIQ